jgi:hypothetical protein
MSYTLERYTAMRCINRTVWEILSFVPKHPYLAPYEMCYCTHQFVKVQLGRVPGGKAALGNKATSGSKEDRTYI